MSITNPIFYISRSRKNSILSFTHRQDSFIKLKLAFKCTITLKNLIRINVKDLISHYIKYNVSVKSRSDINLKTIG